MTDLNLSSSQFFFFFFFKFKLTSSYNCVWTNEWMNMKIILFANGRQWKWWGWLFLDDTIYAVEPSFFFVENSSENVGCVSGKPKHTELKKKTKMCSQCYLLQDMRLLKWNYIIIANEMCIARFLNSRFPICPFFYRLNYIEARAPGLQ